MNDYTPRSGVELAGQELERARMLMEKAQASMREAQNALADLGALVMGALSETRTAVAVELAPPPAEDHGGHFKACYYDDDGHCLACWEDPPGECRPCSDNKPGPMSPAPPTLITLSR